MYEIDPFSPDDIPEGIKINKMRLTPPQKEALTQIYVLNLAYPKRWFTQCELDHVQPVTLEALVNKGFSTTKLSAANPKVQYWQRTGKHC